MVHIEVGTKIWFEGEVQGYTVQARDQRYLICTKPFNPKRTVLYCIVDLEKKIRGPENLVFSMGAETQEQCKEMLARVNGKSEDNVGFQTEISHRHYAPLHIRKTMTITELVP